MSYIHCRFTLLLTDGSAVTHVSVLVVQTIPPHVVYPLHTRLVGRCALTDGPRPAVPRKLSHALYLLHTHTSLDGTCAVTLGPGAVVPRIGHVASIHCTFLLNLTDFSALIQRRVTLLRTIRVHHVCPLQIHTSLDTIRTPSRTSSSIAKKDDDMSYIRCTLTLILTDGSAVRQGPVPVVPTKMAIVVYPLHIPSSLEWGFCIHSQSNSSTANNTRRCRKSIAHSH